MEEREINLLDLLIDILLHWRGFCIFMLVAGIAMGGFSYIRSSRATGTASKEKELEEEWENDEEYREHLEKELTEPEKVSVYSVLQTERQYKNTLEYIDNSILMHIDPHNVQKAELVFGVRAEDPGMTITLSNLYDAFANGVGIYDWLAENNGMTPAMASEIVSLRRLSGVLVVEGNEPSVVGNDTLKVTITHSDEEKCKELAQSVVDYVEAQHDKIEQVIGEYEVELLNQTFSTTMDVSLMNQQNSYNNTIISLLSSIENSKEAFTDDQKGLYRLLKGDEEEEEEEEEEADEVAAPSVSLKYVILGMFLAAFIYAGILFCKYVFNGRLRATDNLGELFGISQLGLIPGQQKKKKFLGFIDGWILALRDHNKRKFSSEEAMELAATAVKISAGKNMLDTVYLMGCDLKEGAMELCQQIKGKLEQENIHVHVLNNVLYNAEILEQLEEAKGVVLVERAGSTLYTEIVKELELLKRQEIKAIGGIVVE